MGSLMLKTYGVEFLGNSEASALYFQWFVKNILRKRVINSRVDSYSRHKIYFCDGVSFWVKFDREWLFSFNKQFPEFIKEFPNYAGCGESINIEYLQKAVKWNIDWMVFINKEGYVYGIKTKELLDFCKKHKLYRLQNKSNNYLKPDYTKRLEAENEMTYSFPIGLLQPLDQIFKVSEVNNYNSQSRSPNCEKMSTEKCSSGDQDIIEEDRINYLEEKL